MVVGYCLAPVMAVVQLLIEGSQALVSMLVSAVMWVGLHSLSSLLAGAGQLIAIKGLEASVVVSVTASSVIVTQLLATRMGEDLVMTQVIGSVIIMVGVIALKYSRGETSDKQSMPISVTSVVALFVSFLCFGLSPVLQKHATTLASNETLMLTRSLCDSTVFLLLLLPFVLVKSDVRGHLKNGRFWVIALAAGGTGTIATMGSYFALSIGTAGHVTALTQTYPALTYVLAMFLLNESFSKVRLVGILTIITGGVVVH